MLSISVNYVSKGNVFALLVAQVSECNTIHDLSFLLLVDDTHNSKCAKFFSQEDTCILGFQSPSLVVAWTAFRPSLDQV